MLAHTTLQLANTFEALSQRSHLLSTISHSLSQTAYPDKKLHLLRDKMKRLIRDKMDTTQDYRHSQLFFDDINRGELDNSLRAKLWLCAQATLSDKPTKTLELFCNTETHVSQSLTSTFGKDDMLHDGIAKRDNFHDFDLGLHLHTIGLEADKDQPFDGQQDQTDLWGAEQACEQNETVFCHDKDDPHDILFLCENPSESSPGDVAAEEGRSSIEKRPSQYLQNSRLRYAEHDGLAESSAWPRNQCFGSTNYLRPSIAHEEEQLLLEDDCLFVKSEADTDDMLIDVKGDGYYDIAFHENEILPI
jgi:hypothetical protein